MAGDQGKARVMISNGEVGGCNVVTTVMFTMPVLVLFRSVRKRAADRLSLIEFFVYVLTTILMGLFLRGLLFELFSPVHV